MAALPYGANRETKDAARANAVLGRKDGGRTKTPRNDIHISINTAPKPPMPMDMPPKMPPPGPPMPAMAPPGAGPPPMGAGAMGPPPPGLGGLGAPKPLPGAPNPLTGMKRGGAVSVANKVKHTNANKQIENTRGIGIRKAVGGSMTAGAESGPGRLQKTRIAARQNKG